MASRAVRHKTSERSAYRQRRRFHAVLSCCPPLHEPAPVVDPRLSQNARVRNFTIGSDESPRQVHQSIGRNATSADELIEQAYRQIHLHTFKVNRDSTLEMKLRSTQITVRNFVRELLLFRKFRNDFYRCNSNDRMVGRMLGRPVPGNQERLELSIMLAEHGLVGLVDHLLNSDKYMDTFGFDTVPYQRARVLAGQAQGTLTCNQQAPRYWREAIARRIWQGIVSTGGFALTALLFYVAAPMLSTGRTG